MHKVQINKCWSINASLSCMQYFNDKCRPYLKDVPKELFNKCKRAEPSVDDLASRAMVKLIEAVLISESTIRQNTVIS